MKLLTHLGRLHARGVSTSKLVTSLGRLYAEVASVVTIDVVFEDDFETGDFSKWHALHENAVYGGEPTIEECPPLHDTYHMEVDVGEGTTYGYAEALFSPAGNVTAVYVGFWFYPEDLADGSDGRIFSFVSAASAQQYPYIRWTTDGKLRLEFSGAQVDTSDHAFPADQPRFIEIYAWKDGATYNAQVRVDLYQECEVLGEEAACLWGGFWIGQDICDAGPMVLRFDEVTARLLDWPGWELEATTLTPDATIATAAIPAPVTSAPLTLTPDPAIGIASVPDPTLVLGAIILTPDAVGAPAAIPAPTLAFGAITLAPDALAAPSIIPDPTLAFGAISVSPDPTAAAAAVPDSTLSTPLTLTPDPVDAPAAIPAPALAFGAISLAPDAVAATAAIPAPTLLLPLGLTPDSVTATAAVPDSTISRPLALTPDPAAAPASLPPITIDIGAITLTPTPATGSAAVPTITTSMEGTPQVIAPTPVTASASVPEAALAFGALALTPSTIEALASVPAPVIAATLALLPNPATAPAAIPTITIIQVGGHRYILASPAVATALVPSPTLLFGAITLTPGVTAGAGAVPDVSTALTLALTPSPVAAVAALADPTLAMGTSILAPSPAVAIVVVPTPFVGGIYAIKVIELTGSIDTLFELAGSIDTLMEMEGDLEMATTENADWVCGEAVTIRITIAGEGTIAGYTFAAAIRRGEGSTPVITKTSGDGLSIYDAAGRIIELTIDRSDSEDLASGGYVWDVFRIDEGCEACLTRGNIELRPRRTVFA